MKSNNLKDMIDTEDNTESLSKSIFSKLKDKILDIEIKD